MGCEIQRNQKGRKTQKRVRQILIHTRERERQTQRIKNLHRAEISLNEHKSSHQGCNLDQKQPVSVVKLKIFSISQQLMVIQQVNGDGFIKLMKGKMKLN